MNIDNRKNPVIKVSMRQSTKTRRKADATMTSNGMYTADGPKSISRHFPSYRHIKPSKISPKPIHGKNMIVSPSVDSMRFELWIGNKQTPSPSIIAITRSDGCVMLYMNDNRLGVIAT